MAKDSLCCSSAGPCGPKLLETYNSGISEIVYVQTLAKHARAVCPKFEPHFVIDTSRNGNADARDADACDSWCNLRAAGLGVAPTTATALGIVDAYFWVKTPGESDGCSATLADGKPCARYDGSCGLKSSLTPAPEAGVWFPAAFLSLAANGVPRPLRAVGTTRAAVAEWGVAGGGSGSSSEGTSALCTLLLWAVPALCVAAFVGGQKWHAFRNGLVSVGRVEVVRRRSVGLEPPLVKGRMGHKQYSKVELDTYEEEI